MRATSGRSTDGLQARLATGLEIERLHLPGLLATEDRRAGMPNFIENGARKATSTGR